MKVLLQPQSGLGDLVFALPQIFAHVKHGDDVTVATNYSEALAPFGDAVKVVPVVMDGAVGKLIPGATFLRYNKYQGNYFDTYYYDQRTSLRDAVRDVRGMYRSFYPNYEESETYKNYTLYAPPRAAHRHRHLNGGAFECAPNVAAANAIAKTFTNLHVLMHAADTYAPEFRILDFYVVALVTQCYTLRDLFTFVANASRGVSQISAVTAIAGLFGAECLYLPGAAERLDLHSRHVSGVAWP